MKFGSVCSGIEAASVAWNPLGWKAQWLAEIEPFPCSLLKHHYPDTPNLGDMTKFNDWPTDDKHAIDLLCGGTPCQSFSVAGLRKGLDDPRGNLMLTFGAIAAKYRPQWLVWENVPGVLSSNGGRDFGSFLGMLGQLGYGFAYRVLDAQYFGVAQRRRRVFVVGCFGDWRSAAAVLFERHSLQGHPAPSRQAGKGTTTRTERGFMPSSFGGYSEGVSTLRKAGGDYGGGTETLCVATGQAGAEIGADMAPTLNCNHEAPYVVGALACNTGPNGHDAGNFLCNQAVDAGYVLPVLPFDTTQITSAANYSNPKAGDPCHPLAAQAHVPCIAFPERMSGTQCASAVDIAPSMGAANPTAVVFGWSEELNALENLQPTIQRGGAGGRHEGVAYSTKLHNTTSNNAGKIFEERTACLDANSPPPALLTAMQVRRLTPGECESLQGFPQGYTNVPHRGKPAADGPRYKALGNSWAVPNVRWIGERINLVSSIQQLEIAA